MNLKDEAAKKFLDAYGTDREWEKFKEARGYIRHYYKEWLRGKKNIDSDVGETAKECAKYSPTWLSIMIDDPEETGGFISLAFTPFPEDTSGFEEIYPQDIAIYCGRIDALRHPDKTDYIRGLFVKLHEDSGFKKFPRATAKFVFSGLWNKIKSKLLFWKKPKWQKIKDGEVE